MNYRKPFSEPLDQPPVFDETAFVRWLNRHYPRMNQNALIEDIRSKLAEIGSQIASLEDLLETADLDRLSYMAGHLNKVRNQFILALSPESFKQEPSTQDYFRNLAGQTTKLFWDYFFEHQTNILSFQDHYPNILYRVPEEILPLQVDQKFDDFIQSQSIVHMPEMKFVANNFSPKQGWTDCVVVKGNGENYYVILLTFDEDHNVSDLRPVRVRPPETSSSKRGLLSKILGR